MTPPPAPREPQTAAGRSTVALLRQHWGEPYTTDTILAIEAEAARSPRDPHQPGDPHEYDLRCTVCGQKGVLRVSIDPDREPAVTDPVSR